MSGILVNHYLRSRATTYGFMVNFYMHMKGTLRTFRQMCRESILVSKLSFHFNTKKNLYFVGVITAQKFTPKEYSNRKSEKL